MGLSTVKICGSGHSSKKCVMRWSAFWPCLCGLMNSESCAEVTAHSAKTARAAEDKLGGLGRCPGLRYMPMAVLPVVCFSTMIGSEWRMV